MKEQEDPPSVFFDDSFKPPDRSTSAPPVLSLHTESLFAFRAAEHLHLFSDIRCEDNYYEFYKKYQNQDKLPPPLQTQPPFLVERSFVRPGDEEQQRAYEQQHYAATEPRNVVHPARPNPNPSFMRQNIYDTYDPSRLDDLPADSPTNEAIWTPLYHKMASLVLDEEEKQVKRPSIQHQRRDPYYPNDFDVAYSTTNQILKEDNNNIQSLWSDRAFDAQNFRNNNPAISTPTPIMPSPTSPLLSLLTNGKNHANDHNVGGYFPEVSSSPIDTIGLPKISPRRRASSGERINIVPSSTTPPLPPSGGAQASSPTLPTCRYFAQGYCSRGDRCNFVHEGDTPTLQQPLVPPLATPVTPPTPMPSLALPEPTSLFNKTNKSKKGTTPSPPLPQSSSASVGLSMLGMPTSPGLQQLVDNNHPNHNHNHNNNGNNNGHNNVLNKKGGAVAQASPVRSPAGSRINGGPTSLGGSTAPTEITFPNGHMSPSGSAPTPLSPGGSAISPTKTDLTRQYTSIEQVVGHIYSLCKDQHGCRFLQKKLEDREPNVAEYIFSEVYDHMTELMTDPFGNYLCQKLLEHCDDAQRLEVIQRVSTDLVKISKNMHGTRAVQKMIEYLTTPAQIALVKKALANSVVTLIQDLNGNHVIQRCLNRLSPQDNQFIYDSVSQAGHCVEVATHRHGCCVLQRCIDHASDSQKMQLINEVIANALVLVQDPYGNYVVQYVLDLAFPGLASELARRFLGHIPILSTQKFSSNVIEKCLNVADASTRAVVIQELVEYDNLLYLLQDPYANYVIQTSLNVSEPMQHARLVEAIRPHLTSLRNTPYGKRIQNKIQKESSRDYYA